MSFNFDEIKEGLRQLASTTSRAAYAPYSQFQVGAAIITADGKIFSGCNVENASYGLTNCAERTAIFNMISHVHNAVLGAETPEIAAVVIFTPTDEPTAPCGACRQVINEFGSPDTVIHSFCNTEKSMTMYLREILPKAFGPKNLL